MFVLLQALQVMYTNSSLLNKDQNNNGFLPVGFDSFQQIEFFFAKLCSLSLGLFRNYFMHAHHGRNIHV